jgi:hypothetical protein
VAQAERAQPSDAKRMMRVEVLCEQRGLRLFFRVKAQASRQLDYFQRLSRLNLNLEPEVHLKQLVKRS